MTSAEIFLPVKFPGLNDYTKANRSNRFVGGAMKTTYTDMVTLAVKRLKHFDNPVKIKFKWTEENKRRDPDNVIFAKKFILDGLVKAGILPNDTQEWVKGFEDTWDIDKNNVGVRVTITEA